jgi:hypothetical protein
MASKILLILRRPQSGRLEGRRVLIRDNHPCPPQYPNYERRIDSSWRSSAAVPAMTSVPVSMR